MTRQFEFQARCKNVLFIIEMKSTVLTTGREVRDECALKIVAQQDESTFVARKLLSVKLHT